jgi:GTP cyclohydrolase I
MDHGFSDSMSGARANGTVIHGNGSKYSNGINGHRPVGGNHSNSSPISACGHDCEDDHHDHDGLSAHASVDPSPRDLDAIASHMHAILGLVGENPEREGLLKTPMRVAKALDFLTSGYQTDISELLNGAVFNEQYDEIVSIKNIHFFSMCEHHMLPFYGIANVAYIPNGKVIGLSKIPRIVDAFSRRLQVQERLTNQIARCLQEVLNPRGVAVVMEGHHMCMAMRGVQKQNCTTVTSSMIGDFKTNLNTRQEFLTLCGSHSILR